MAFCKDLFISEKNFALLLKNTAQSYKRGRDGGINSFCSLTPTEIHCEEYLADAKPRGVSFSLTAFANATALFCSSGGYKPSFAFFFSDLKIYTAAPDVTASRETPPF